MFRRKKPPTAHELANSIARDIARRGWPAEAKPAIINSPFERTTRWIVNVPCRGVAVINDGLSIAVASSNRPTSRAITFNHTTAEIDAEQTMRNLPLP